MVIKNARRILGSAFVENNDSVNEDIAAELIVKAEQKIKEIEEEKSADEKLAAAKNIVKDLNSSYTSAIKYEKAKINYLLEKINEIQSGEVNPSSGANV
jgi:hypothetical protein